MASWKLACIVLQVGEVKSISLQQRPYDASLNSAGKHRLVSDLLINKPTKGKSSPPTSLTSHMDAASSWHVLFRAELISFATSSTVTAVKSASDDVTRRGTSYSGVAAVDARTESTVSLNYLAKSSAKYGLSSSRVESRHGVSATAPECCRCPVNNVRDASS